MSLTLPLLGALFFASGAIVVAGLFVSHAFSNRKSSGSQNGALTIFDNEEPVNQPTDTLFQPKLKKAHPIQ